ncbi:MAG: HDOD domain-containing protein [Fimbriimonadaceae bacterium]|nr:HDOD domain-containing protein [Fimbriimonadaceae bacterium]
MSGSRLDSDHERVQAVWLTAKKLTQHPMIEGLIGRTVMFAQVEPQRASIMERLIAPDNPIHPSLKAALDVFVPGEESINAKSEQLGDVKATAIALAVCYHQVIRVLSPIAGLDSSAVFKQAVAVATASEIFAERSCRFPPIEAFGAGLFHHLGVILMGVTHNQSYRGLLSAVKESHGNLADAEKKAYGYSHDETATVIGEACNLPAHIQDGMVWHDAEPSGQRTVGLCVSLAVRHCHSMGFDAGLSDTIPALAPTGLRCVGVGEHNSDRIAELIRTQVESFTQVSSAISNQAA